MDRAFRDDDREKTVVTHEGNTVGRVRDVNDDRATVERTDDHDSLTDKIKDMLGWDEDDDSHELRRDHVARHENDKFHLRER